MASKTKTESKSSLEHTGEHTSGIPAVVHLALEVADRGQATAIAVLQDARTELRTAVDSGLELAEKLAQGALRFSRKLVAKVDEATSDALTGAEQALSSAVRRARETARSGELAPARSQAA